ncbi:MAG: aspartate carbamoyltransferase, partial [Verrucomicrobia bacterium]|nr:aspartate carbamoyltransferase [Verrucomicrobiota bacterium]
MNWTRKDLIDIESLSAEEIRTLLACARQFKQVCLSPRKHAQFLQGYTVINFFVEPSTRT